MTDMSELNRRMRALWDETHESDPSVAAPKLFAALPATEFTTTYVSLLEHAYSTFLSQIGTEKSREQRRSRPTVNPARYRAQLLAEIAMRPFRVPSRGAVRVHFQDMTPAYWLEWIEAKEARINGYRANIEWAQRIITLMTEHHVDVSGGLPDDVKVELFQAPGHPDRNTE
jgi:hypothetical protein